MNMLPGDVKPFVESLRAAMPRIRTSETVLCVPHTHITSLRRALKDSRISIGAQDVSVHAKGAYTGEVSARMLGNLNVKYVITGHSERREFHGETDFLVGQKAAAIMEAGMIPIVCVGETLEQREHGITMEHVACQTKAALSFLPEDKIKHCVIAYEPIWAIGTGKTASPEEAQEVCNHIRKVVRECYGARVARATSILYGGSMNAANAQSLLSMPDIDGGLIGGASLKHADFAQIIGAVDLVIQEGN